ncbi:hypothetical protein FIV06_20730 [Labrenzia sp. THAF191b]|nr:hypothetical protein FIV06_20730 [Labrenzia sp. THAF191b]QFT06180.1 hypothetical protein FIV05_20725 [Labrenzia sp. THAF191a]QFT17724.1 hypothetical protein FIV03_20740 [Labrenzia sp. THAF187b]
MGRLPTHDLNTARVRPESGLMSRLWSMGKAPGQHSSHRKRHDHLIAARDAKHLKRAECSNCYASNVSGQLLAKIGKQAHA